MSDQRPWTARFAPARRLAKRLVPPLGALHGREPACPQRREGVVGDLAGPGQVPQRGVKLLGGALQLGDEVEPEAGAGGQPLADRVMHLALRRVELRVGGRRAGQPDVLAEVEGHAAGAAQRPRADPHDLTAGGELVQPALAVRAQPAGQHVALPDLRRERNSLQRDERLAQAVGARAGGAVRVDVLPVGKEPGELAGGRRPRPPCAGAPGWRGGPVAGRRRRTTRARSRPGGARRERGCPSARAPAAPGLGRPRSGGEAARWGTGRGCARSGAPARPSRRECPPGTTRAGRPAAARPGRRGTCPRHRPAIHRSSPAIRTFAARRSASSLPSIDSAE